MEPGVEYGPSDADREWLDAEQERYDALSPEQHAAEDNYTAAYAGSSTRYVVVDGYVVNQSGAAHARAHPQTPAARICPANSTGSSASPWPSSSPGCVEALADPLARQRS